MQSQFRGVTWPVIKSWHIFLVVYLILMGLYERSLVLGFRIVVCQLLAIRKLTEVYGNVGGHGPDVPEGWVHPTLSQVLLGHQTG